MGAEKYSASMSGDLLGTVRADAESEGRTLSGWLAEAAADRLRLKALHHLVSEWEAVHGSISVAELDALDLKVAEARRRSRSAMTNAERALTP